MSVLPPPAVPWLPLAEPAAPGGGPESLVTDLGKHHVPGVTADHSTLRSLWWAGSSSCCPHSPGELPISRLYGALGALPSRVRPGWLDSPWEPTPVSARIPGGVPLEPHSLQAASPRASLTPSHPRHGRDLHRAGRAARYVQGIRACRQLRGLPGSGPAPSCLGRSLPSACRSST